MAVSTARTAASVTAPRYRLLFGSGLGDMSNSSVAQMGPVSMPSSAWRTVTPQHSSSRSIAQSSDEGPRSPLIPGCTMRQVWWSQISRGIARFSIGATMRSGRCSFTAFVIASSPVAR